MEKQWLRDAIDLRAQVERDTTLKKTAGTKGGEYCGPCPFPGCGGRDRFRFWPNHPSGHAQYWCRGCQRAGDAIQYVMERDGLTFRQVCQEYGDGARSGHKTGNNCNPFSKRSTANETPARPPAADWQTDALALVAEFEAVLWSEEGAKARDWLRARGLTDDTIESWRLGLCPKKDTRPGCPARGVTIPWLDARGRLYGVKIATGKRKAGQKYVAVTGSRFGTGLYGIDRFLGLPDCVIVEGEFDALLLWQEVGDLADVLTLGGAKGHLSDRWLAALLPVKRFWIATDNDAQGDEAAARWLTMVGERGQRVYPPAGEKDVGDAWKAGADLRAWIVAHVGGGDREKDQEAVLSNDKTEPVPEPEPMVELGTAKIGEMHEWLDARGLDLVDVRWPQGEPALVAMVERND